MEAYTHIYDTNFYVDSTFEDPDEIPHDVLAKTIRKKTRRTFEHDGQRIVPMGQLF